jgi:hypothetical protein
MLISIYIMPSLVFMLTYTILRIFHKNKLIRLSNLDTALLKLVSILCLIEKDATSWIYNITLVLYATGDLIIIWNQSLSLIFFQLGHLFFLSTYFQNNSYYQYYFLPFFAIITFGVHYYLVFRHNTNLCKRHYEYLLYWVYIFVSQCFLLVPVCQGYFGTIPFIISDISIGFELDVFSKFEYPLYYCSLLYLRYSHLI